MHQPAREPEKTEADPGVAGQDWLDRAENLSRSPADLRRTDRLFVALLLTAAIAGTAIVWFVISLR